MYAYFNIHVWFLYICVCNFVQHGHDFCHINHDFLSHPSYFLLHPSRLFVTSIIFFVTSITIFVTSITFFCYIHHDFFSHPTIIWSHCFDGFMIYCMLDLFPDESIHNIWCSYRLLCTRCMCLLSQSNTKRQSGNNQKLKSLYKYVTMCGI